MGDLINLNDHRDRWQEVLTVDGDMSTLQVYTNSASGEIDIVQMNDEGEAIRTLVSADNAELLFEALRRNLRINSTETSRKM